MKCFWYSIFFHCVKEIILLGKGNVLLVTIRFLYSWLEGRKKIKILLCYASKYFCDSFIIRNVSLQAHQVLEIRVKGNSISREK